MKLASLDQDSSSSSPPDHLLVGIDWADRDHAFCLRAPDGKLHQGTFRQSPETVADWVRHWSGKFPGLTLDVCLETSHNALINALREFPQVRLVQVNPAAMASYRKALAHGGGKNDPVDAYLILMFFQSHYHQLRPLQQDSPQTRELLSLARDRRTLVQRRVLLDNQLTGLLKLYFPTILLLKPAKIHAEFVVALLARYPTLEAVQAAGKTRLRKFFYGMNLREKIEERLEILTAAKPLTTDEVLIRTSARHCQALVAQLDVLNEQIKSYDQQIKRLVAQHPDYPVVKELPGASFRTQARILGALGDDRTRFASPEALQAAAGIAPLTTRSGRSQVVSARWAHSTFTRQTFHEFAGLSIKRCTWAKAYYESQLARGKSKQMAKRALAYKWIRIIFRCWQTGQAYHEATYINSLQSKGSPYAKAG